MTPRPSRIHAVGPVRTLSATRLPQGLTINPTSGVIGGTIARTKVTDEGMIELTPPAVATAYAP